MIEEEDEDVDSDEEPKRRPDDDGFSMKIEDSKGPKTSGGKKLKTSIANQVRSSMTKALNDFESG